MNMRGHSFQVDKENAKIAGVCAGIANQLEIDPTIVRIGFVIAAIAVMFPLFLVAYGVLAMVGQPKRGLNRPTRSGNRLVSREETRERMRDLDRRMQEIESYVTSSNSKLAREIEELR